MLSSTSKVDPIDLCADNAPDVGIACPADKRGSVGRRAHFLAAQSSPPRVSERNVCWPGTEHTASHPGAYRQATRGLSPGLQSCDRGGWSLFAGPRSIRSVANVAQAVPPLAGKGITEKDGPSITVMPSPFNLSPNFHQRELGKLMAERNQRNVGSSEKSICRRVGTGKDPPRRNGRGAVAGIDFRGRVRCWVFQIRSLTPPLRE